MLTPLSAVLSQVLEWRQPSPARRTFVLHSGDGPCARLSCTWWRFTGHAETADGRWRLTHGVFWRSNPRAEGDGGSASATFERHFLRRAGHIRIADGSVYAYRTSGVFRRTLVVSAADGRALFRVERAWRWFRTEGRVSFTLAAGECADLALLVVLSWYAMALFAHRRRAAAAAIAG